MNTPKALLYDPYLDTLGGGERYTLTFGDCLTKSGFQVYVGWNDPSILTKAQARFGQDYSKIQADPTAYRILSKSSNLLAKHSYLKKFDLIFFVSDGSIPVLFGKKNFLHYQVPFTKINQTPLLNKLKLSTIDQIIVNSNFTKQIIDKTLNTSKTTVLYPPVDTDSFSSSAKKEKIILNVGRFDSPSHSKRQDVLIQAFSNLSPRYLKNWKLVLAGGYINNPSIIESLKNMATGLPVEFVINPPFAELKQLYSKSSIYWHAAGYEINQFENPELVEHFGITTVEAMSAGCVPVVINKGGQTEIITTDSGFLVEDLKGLVAATESLLSSSSKMDKYSKSAVTRSRDFDQNNFCVKLKQIIT